MRRQLHTSPAKHKNAVRRLPLDEQTSTLRIRVGDLDRLKSLKGWLSQVAEKADTLKTALTAFVLGLEIVEKSHIFFQGSHRKPYASPVTIMKPIFIQFSVIGVLQARLKR